MEQVTLEKRARYRALGLSTFAFTVCFAVWTIFSIIGVKIKAELGLSETQFGLLIATPVLTGSISRVILGIWTEQYGGRLVFPIQMLAAAAATFLLAQADSYATFLAAALGVGLAGGGFIVGTTYVSHWFPMSAQGTALGIFGMGNMGSAVTTFGAPFLIMAMGWERTAQVYAIVLAVTAVIFFVFAKNDPAHEARRRTVTIAPRPQNPGACPYAHRCQHAQAQCEAARPELRALATGHLVACHLKAHISEVGKFVAKTATEVHGGMGFTDLLGLHYWFKRIGFNRQLLGTPEWLRREAARTQGLVHAP